jgi:hypothetical protein
MAAASPLGAREAGRGAQPGPEGSIGLEPLEPADWPQCILLLFRSRGGDDGPQIISAGAARRDPRTGRYGGGGPGEELRWPGRLVASRPVRRTFSCH